MPLLELLLLISVSIPLMDWQREYLTDPHKIKVLIAGRQTGKSHCLMAGLTKICATTTGRSAVVMPIQPQATDLYKLMISASNFEHLLLREPKLWPYPQLTFKSGHFLEFRSFENPRRLRGGKWDGVVVCDEANDLDGEMISRVVLPKISATDAQLWIASTITHHNWLYDLYLRGQNSDPIYRSWLKTSEHGYMFQGEAGRRRLLDMESITPKHIFDAEFRCIPSVDNSTLFPYFARCLIDSDPPERPQSGRRYLIGLDLGRVRDAEVAICGDDQGLIVDYLEFPTGNAALEHTQMAGRIDSMSRFWNNARVVIDSTGKGGNTRGSCETDSHVEMYKPVLGDRLEEFYWSANRENATKYEVLSHLALLTEQRKIRCPKKFSALIAQMHGYRILKAKGSSSTFGPLHSGHNDDGVAALAQYAWGMKQKWFGSDGQGQSLASVFG